VKLKLKISLLILASLLLLAGGALTYLFGGPYRFIQVPLQEPSLQYLRSSPAASTPADAADEYLHGLLFPADRPQRQRLEIAVRHVSEQEAIVTVINRFCSDDSLSVTYDRLTLRHQSGVWLPVLHKATWQCRNAIGWTTKTPS
jgi:hypothetical protein